MSSRVLILIKAQKELHSRIERDYYEIKRWKNKNLFRCKALLFHSIFLHRFSIFILKIIIEYSEKGGRHLYNGYMSKDTRSQ